MSTRLNETKRAQTTRRRLIGAESPREQVSLSRLRHHQHTQTTNDSTLTAMTHKALLPLTSLGHKLFSGLLLLLSLLLTGCLERSDSLAPIVTVTSPANGTVRSADNLIISGYAMDDEGIVAIRVDQDDLLAFPIFQNERGRRLVQFGFRPRQIDEGQWQSDIVVEDVSGNVTTLRYILEIDTTPPTLELSPLQNLGGGRLRVTGTARDNQLLERITINDTILSFAAVQERPFSLDFDSAGLDSVTVRVRDQAGNETAQTLTP